MKKIIFGAFLVVFSFTASYSQQIQLVSPANGVLSVKLVSNKAKVDTSVMVKNIGTATVTVKTKVFQSNVIAWRIDDSTETIDPGQTRKIRLYIVAGKYGFLDGRLDITADTTTLSVKLHAEVFHFVLDSPQVDPHTTCSVFDLPVGETVCLPGRVRNPTSKQINIYWVAHQAKKEFILDTLVPMPFVLLPGEEVTIATLCYTATEQGKLDGDGIFISSSMGDGAQNIRITIHTKADTTLAKPCFELSPTFPLIGPTLFNGSQEATLTLKSNRYTDQTIEVDSLTGIDASMFSFSTSLPLTLPALGTAQLNVKFSPTFFQKPIKYRFATTFTVSSETGCNVVPIDISALAMLPTADSISTPLFPDKEYVLGMSSGAASFSQDFHFVNNLSTNVKVLSVALSDGSPEFSITDIKPSNVLPFTLAPSDKMTVTVLFTPSKPNQIFYNQLVFTTENGIQSQKFSLQGLQTPTTSVTEADIPTVSLSLMPNPTTSEVSVAVAGARSITKAQIFDELGNELYHSDSPSGVTLNIELQRTHITGGTYFVRVEGSSLEGKPFVATKRLVVQ